MTEPLDVSAPPGRPERSLLHPTSWLFATPRDEALARRRRRHAAPARPFAESGRRVWAGGFALCFLGLAAWALAPDVEVWLVGESPPGQQTFFNDVEDGGDFGLPVEIGDYDGDGRPDIVIAPMRASSGPGRSREKSGEVYVYPGSGSIAGALDRASLTAEERGLTLQGGRAGDSLGTELYTADVNGDGIEDLMASAQNHDVLANEGLGAPRDNCGGLFVVLGAPGLLDGGPVFDLADEDPAAGRPGQVLRIVGAEPGERLGIWVEAGDIDGDGFDDIAVGADQFSPPGATHLGKTYVIYGRETFPTGVLDLAAPNTEVSVLLGKDEDDHFGASIHVRDLDGDGGAELIVASALNRLSASFEGDIRNGAPPFGTDFSGHATAGADGPPGAPRDQCGEVYVFHNARGQRLPAELDLREPLPVEMEGRLTTIYGGQEDDAAGEELTSGDFDGDGFIDLALGALSATDEFGRRFSGATYLVYWQAGLGGAEIDLADVPTIERPAGLRVSTMRGANAGDILGDTLSAADFDQDGFDDLAIGIPDLDAEEANVGAVAVVYGRPTAFPAFWRPRAEVLPPDLRVRFVVGKDRGDLLSYSMEARDVDGDGYADLFPNAMRGDGADESSPQAGEAVLISGFHLSDASLSIGEVSPSTGVRGQPTEVLIAGTGFTTTEDSEVLVDDEILAEFRVENSARILATLPGTLGSGPHSVRVRNRYGDVTASEAFLVAPTGTFLRGDANLSLTADVSDAVTILFGLFLGQDLLCADAADVDDSGVVQLTDAVVLLEFLFLGGTAPAAPWPEPGTDPTDDGIDCES